MEFAVAGLLVETLTNKEMSLCTPVPSLGSVRPVRKLGPSRTGISGTAMHKPPTSSQVCHHHGQSASIHSRLMHTRSRPPSYCLPCGRSHTQVAHTETCAGISRYITYVESPYI